jgi:hypothetical protein
MTYDVYGVDCMYLRNGVTKYHVEMLYIQYVAAAPLPALHQTKGNDKAMGWSGGLPKKHPMLSFKCVEMLGKYTVCVLPLPLI